MRESGRERHREAERIIRTDLIMCDLRGSAERNSWMLITTSAAMEV
jgi:hypothetical protein